MALVLASQSPRRRQLMALVAPAFEVDEAGVDEAAVARAAGPGAGAEALVLALARAKAQAVWARRPGDVVVGCDTVVEAGGRILGKPGTPAEAEAMLRLLAGNRHFVRTGVCILGPGGLQSDFVETTAVVFGAIPPAEIARYAQTDEPCDKAGGYGIQGWAARWVVRVEGCYYNVVGLPVAALYQRLAGLGALPERPSPAAGGSCSPASQPSQLPAQSAPPAARSGSGALLPERPSPAAGGSCSPASQPSQLPAQSAPEDSP